MKKYDPTAILTADWHIREDKPVCRTDDFWQTQTEKINFVRDLQDIYNCPVIHGGDVFNHWKPSPYLLTTAIKHFPRAIACVYGNHDLPQHSISQSFKCGMDLLKAVGLIQILDTCHWGQEPSEASLVFDTDSGRRHVLVWHTLTYIGDEPWPGCHGRPADQILNEFQQYDLILTGDNHKTFVKRIGDKILVNPGSLMRQSASQIDHKPCVFLWYAETNEVEQVIIPHKPDAVSREHIDEPQERSERLRAYIEHMNFEWRTGLSFKDNLEAFFQKNNTPKEIRDIIWASMETD